MNCEAARRLIGAEPDRTSAELEQHLQGCPACAQFQLEMIALDANIRRALEEPPVAARASARHRLMVSRSGWAMAASVLLLVVSLAVWSLRPTDTLARELVTHVMAEPQSWASTDLVAARALDETLRKSGVVLGATPYSVVYANSCWFRGHYVPHLVVRTAHGLVTVLILRNESVQARQSFHEDGLAGVIVPAATGSIAVLGEGDAQLAEVAEQMRIDVEGSAAAE